MDIALKRGKNFRLLEKSELESVLEILEKHLPYSIKVSNCDGGSGCSSNNAQ